MGIDTEAINDDKDENFEITNVINQTIVKNNSKINID